MSKRVKPTGLITTLSMADRALARYAELSRQKAIVELEMNQAIDAAKARADQAAAPLKEEMAQIETALKAFGEANRAELFVDKKTVELEFGRIGARVSVKLDPMKGCNLGQVAAALLEGGHRNCLRIKHEVDKEALAAWGDSQLLTIGMRRVRSDTIWFEIKSTELEAPAEGLHLASGAA